MSYSQAEGFESRRYPRSGRTESAAGSELDDVPCQRYRVAVTHLGSLGPDLHDWSDNRLILEIVISG